MDNTLLTIFLPYLIRIAAIWLILFSITDYLKRKRASLIVKALKESGADCPESALTLASLEEKYPRITKCLGLLDEYSTLRRVVLLAEDESPEEPAEDTKKKRKTSKKRRLTGDERWYIPAPAPACDEEGEDQPEAPATPALLRLGGETEVRWLILGCILTAVFSELIIHFLPQIMNFFTGLSSLGADS